MEDSQLNINKKIYDFQIEMFYWDRYLIGLQDFILYEKPSKTKKYKIQHEITRVEFYKFKRQTAFTDYLKTYKYSNEFKNKLKTFYNDTKINTNDT